MRFSVAFALLLSLAAPGLAAAADRTIVILDASGSMWGQIDGKTKIEIARDTISQVIPSVSKDTELGLMVYGHRDKGSCSDIQLVVPPAKGTQAEIVDFVKGVTPKGKTPLTQAVREAAEALKYTEEKATVVLVTDGLESCDADPCALAAELESKGVDFTAHVVGFGLTEDEGKKVSCLADRTGGKYFKASDAGQLVAALAATVNSPPAVKEPAEQPVVEKKPAKPENNVVTDSTLSEGGKSLGESTDVQWRIFKAGPDGEPDGDHIDSVYKAGYAANYPVGKYVALVTLDNTIERKVPFEVTEGAVTKPSIDFEAGLVTITAKRTPQDTEPEKNAAIEIRFGDYSTTNYGRLRFYAPAGDVTLKGTIGAATTQETLAVKAGEIIEHDLVIGSGVIDNKAVYAEGGLAVDSKDIFFEIFSPQKDIDGNRARLGYAYGTGTTLDSPVGDFILAATLGSATAQTPYSIKAGERKDVTVNINAGVLAVTAPGASGIEIIDAKKDIQGNSKTISQGFGTEYKDTVPRGDYIVHVTYEGDTSPKDLPATVKAGERTEVKAE